ncbi:MAG: hypothetical protein HDR29_05630, partial [Lachnospiraceae bacterium]|nr:hypothetical protein [Lachnospiraceae bacterium]
MLKRLLAFVLAAALIVETPATAYAAEQTPVTVEDGAQDLVGGSDEADTSSQDGTGIVDNGDSIVEIVEDGTDDSSVNTDTETEDSDETDGTDEAGNTADENVSEDVVSDTASEGSSDDAVLEAEEPLSSIAESIRLVTSGDVLNAEAYSFEDTFTVALVEDAAEDAVLADSYTLSMSISGGTLDGQSLVYAPDGLDSDPVDIVLAKNEEDASASYSKTLCSSDFYYIDSENNKTTLMLSPETQYTLEYSLEWDSETAPVTGTIEFTTVQADMSEPMADEAGDSSVITVSVKPGITGASINFTLNGSINYGDYVICYYKEKDAQDWTYGGSRSFWGYYDFEPFTITGLSPETEHEYKIGSSSNDNTAADALENPVEGKFTTLADNRKVTVTVEPKVSSVVIDYTLSGNLSHSDYIICYYKTKDAQDWTKIDYWFGDEYYPFMISGLSPATEYDYKIGFGSNEATPAADLLKAEEGKFTTLAENRKVTATVEPKVKRATVNYTLSGGYDENGYIYYFYKEKDKTEWSYDSIYIGTEEAAASADYKDSFVLEGLKPATEYNYKIGFADVDENLTPDKLKGECAESTFTTLADQRKLSDAKAEVVESVSAPKIRLNAFFSGNIENDYTYIHYFYKEKAQAGTEGAAAWQYSSSVTTSSVQRYCLQSITDGIEWGKTYEYAIVVSDSDYYNYYEDKIMVNPDEITKEGFKLTGTVEVPAAKAPTSVTLSQKEIYLNVGSVGEGCDYQTIKADIAPADANKALICSSEDSSVAYAYYDDGSITVEAAGVGTTTIKVRSPYSTDSNAVLAEIKVEVGSYAIFKKVNGTVDTEKPMFDVSYPKFTDGKFTESIEEYLLYKWDKDTTAWTSVEGFKVTSENESIVTWKEAEKKLVTGKSAGKADLVFTDAEGKFKA